VDLLSSVERDLCSALRLLPAHYLVIKDVLVRESFRLGYLRKDVARQLVKINVRKTDQVASNGV
jgi:transcriptional adapter 2-alpha